MPRLQHDSANPRPSRNARDVGPRLYPPASAHRMKAVGPVLDACQESSDLPVHGRLAQGRVDTYGRNGSQRCQKGFLSSQKRSVASTPRVNKKTALKGIPANTRGSLGRVDWIASRECDTGNCPAPHTTWAPLRRGHEN